MVYFGMYDNDMCFGWWKKVMEEEKERVKKYLWFYKDIDVYWEFICGVVVLVVRIVIIFM